MKAYPHRKVLTCNNTSIAHYQRDISRLRHWEWHSAVPRVGVEGLAIEAEVEVEVHLEADEVVAEVCPRVSSSVPHRCATVCAL